MHELNICLSIVRVIEEEAGKNYFRRVKKLWLEIGNLAGIEIAALRFSFPIAAKQSIAENAELEIVSVSGRAECEICQADIELLTLLSPCPYCKRFNYRIRQGIELKILKMEVI